MVKNKNGNHVRIRRAKISDAARLADLSGELGYPATGEEIRKRFRRMRAAPANALFVAESNSGDVLGWAHVSVNHLLEVGTRAELNGLVVAEGHRSLGAGAKLLEAAESWARKHRCPVMSVRSNVLRDRAHQFYLRQGYEHYKSQKAFRKPL